MKISTFTQFDNNSYSLPSFGAGWTPAIARQVDTCDISKITERLAQKGIESDFKGNKVIAWCCDQTLRIFEELNAKYKLKLALPQGIFVEDFVNLDIPNQTAYGLCNWYPSNTVKNSDRIYPERTLFFNSFETLLSKLPESERWRYLWQNIDAVSDESYSSGFASTDGFLNYFTHEFSHSAHNGHLSSKFGRRRLPKRLEQLSTPEYLVKFRRRHGSQLSQISWHSATNPLEAVANDMSRLIVSSLDESLSPRFNPFKKAPYPQKGNIRNGIRRLKSDNTQNSTCYQILRKIWSGKAV